MSRRRRSLLVVSALLLAAPVAGTQAVGAPAEVERVAVIVELDGAPALAAAEGADPVADADSVAAQSRRNDRARQVVLAAADDADLEYTVTRRFDTVFNGMALEIRADEQPDVAGLPGVRAVHPDRTVSADLSASVPLVGAPDVWAKTDGQGSAVRGSGVTVAIIDSGIDYRHPALGSGFGTGFKVVHGYDFVNDDADPMDDNGHGTHVAGIVAGDGEVTGVAPAADLVAYKALNGSGNGLESDVIAAIDAATDPDNPHRADVINMSLSAPGDGTDPLGRAAATAVDAGVVVVASAGNTGPAGTVTSPGSADGVLTVGASTSGVTVPRLRAVNPASFDLQAARQWFSANPPDAARTLSLVDGGEGTVDELDRLDVAGKAVLINPRFAPLDSAALLDARGAAAVLFYIPDLVITPTAGGAPGSEPLTDAFAVGADESRLDTVVAVNIPGATATRLLGLLDRGGVSLELDGVDATDEMADFSTHGPGGVFGAQPHVVAPGVEVRSTYLDGGFARMSGTSMAAPHVAGAAALIRQLRPEWSADEIVGAVTGTARRLSDVGPLAQGQGRLDVAAAAEADVVATPASVSLGLADLGGDAVASTGAFTLTNRGDDLAELALRATPFDDTGATVSVTPATATLEPGEEVVVTLAASVAVPDADVDLTGWIEVDAADKAAPSLGLPYSMSVRHLAVHATPDPAVPGADVTVTVVSPARLAEPPAVTITCPGAGAITVAATARSATSWRAVLPAGDVPGLCPIEVAAMADPRYGSAVDLVGTGLVEVAEVAEHNPAAARWRPAGPNGEGAYLDFDPTNRTGVFASTPGGFGIFASGDAMDTWRELRTLPVASGVVEELVVDPNDGRRLYAAVSSSNRDSSYVGRFFISDDGGQTWSAADLPDAAATAVAIDPAGQALAVAMGRDVFRSTDGGLTWTRLPSAWTSVRSLAWAGSDLFVGTTTGIWVVRDALGDPQAPSKVFAPWIIQFVDQIAVDDDLIVAATWFEGLVASRDAGKTWTTLFAPPTGSKRILGFRLEGDDYFAISSPGRTWASRDRGTTWEEWADPVPPAIEFDIASWPDPHPAKAGMVYVSSSTAGIFETSDGADYTRVGVPGATVFDLASTRGPDGTPVVVAATTEGTYRTEIPARESISPAVLEWGPSAEGAGDILTVSEFVATSPADARVMWKTMVDGFDRFGVYRSDDAGTTWTRVVQASENPYALAVHPADPDSVYVAYASLTGAGVLVTHDGGRSWEKQDARRTFDTVAGDPTDPDRVLAGSFEGLFESTDQGRSWQRVSPEPVTTVAFDPADPSHVVVGGLRFRHSHDGARTFTAGDYAPLDIYVRDIAFHPRDDQVVFAATSDFFIHGVRKGGRGVLISRDGGATWHSFAAGLANRDATSLTATPDGRHLIVGTVGGSTYRLRLPD